VTAEPSNSLAVAPSPADPFARRRAARTARILAHGDAFPNTRRPLPWLLAAFMVMVFVVPIDQTTLKISLPFSAEIDRLAVVILLAAWFWFGGDQRTIARSPRSKLYIGAAGTFLAVAIASVIFDSEVVVRLGEWSLAQKQLALLVSFFAMAWFALTAIRTEDLRGFASLLIGLGVVVGLGIIVERRTGYNVFYAISGKVLSPIAHVTPPTTNINLADSADDRLTINGPAATGVAAAVMLAMVMPFALMRVFDPASRRSRNRNALAVMVMLTGALATDKKSAVVVPVVILAYVGLHRPKRMLQFVPLVLVVIGFAHAASPGALGTVLNPAQWFGSNSTVHRQTDLAAITPDVLAHPVLGRGFGSIDVTQPDQFRILDNQILGVLWQTGILGLAAYVSLILAPAVIARRSLRSPDPELRRVALAGSAACLGFLVANYLFDALSFTQTPYIFFCVAAMCTALSGRTEPGLGLARTGAVGPPIMHAPGRVTAA
jgi:hypothetical protein